MRGRALVAINLRRIRTERGISQERLAADSGVDRAYVSEIETEKFAASVDVLDRLAEVLDCQVMELFQEPAPGAEVPKVLKGGRKIK